MRHGRRGVELERVAIAGMALWLFTPPPLAHAQPAPDAPPAPPAQTTTAPAPSAGDAPAATAVPTAPTRVLVQASGDASPQLKSSLGGALEAQFAALDLALEIDVNAQAPASAAERFERGRTLAAASHARAVFWIELDGQAQWFVFMMDPLDERILVRPVDASAPAAAVEAVAVIVKASTQALLAGNLDSLEAEELAPPPPAPPLVAEPAPTPPPAAPSPPPPPREPEGRGGLRLALGYAGCTFADEHTWQSGLSLTASWIARSGLYGGLGYAWYAATVPDDPVGIEVRRHPVTALFGKRLWKGALAVDLELGLVVDVLTRHTTDTPGGYRASGDSTRVVAALAPRLRTELTVVAPVALFLDLGLGYVLNNFEYIATDPERVVLSPHRLRAELGAGVAVRL